MIWSSFLHNSRQLTDKEDPNIAKIFFVFVMYYPLESNRDPYKHLLLVYHTIFLFLSILITLLIFSCNVTNHDVFS